MKSLLNVFPALAVALLMTACTAPEQPKTPQTPVSVERALEATLDKAGEMVDGETEVNTELDAALDTLEEELDAALDGDVEVTVETTPAETEVMTEAEVPDAEAAVEQLSVDADGQVDSEEQGEEDEIIDQPIIIE